MKKFKNTCLKPVLLALSLVAVCGSASAADNIVAVADKAGTFKTLLAAAKAAGLVHALQEDGPLTVFAPTDDAVAKLPAHTLTDLLKLENKEKLATILKYHVIPGKVTAKEAVQVGSAKTLSGDSVSISIRDGRLVVNDARVIVNDVEASNGVIHVIDSVLLPPEPKKKSVLTVAEEAGGFSTLLAAIDAAGLREVLEGEGPFTVFAPTDKAFAEFAFEEATTFGLGERFPKGSVENLLKPENKAKLAAILTYHVVPGKVSSRQTQLLAIDHGKRAAEKVVATVNGQKLDLTYLASSNPDRAKSRLLVNDATVVKADIEAGNGVIHVIDSVLIPPEPKNIVETAAAEGNFKTLIAALNAAGLVETLKADGPFTVLAPSDEAFGKLGKETLASLLETKNKRKLRSVLEYHLIPRRLSFDDIKDLTAIKTVQGAEVRVQEGNDPFADSDLLINQSNIISGDIDAANGIIHVIDSVLMPPADVKAGHQNSSHISPASSSPHSGAELLEIQEQNRDLIHIRELDCFFPACWKFRVYIPQNRGTTLRLTSGICQGSKFSVDQLTRTDSIEIPPHIDGGEFDISVTIRLIEEGQYACYIFVADPGKRTFWKSVNMPPVPDLRILTNPWEKFAQSSKRVMRTKTFHKEVKMYKFGEPIPLVVLNKGERDEFKASDITAQSTPAVWLTFPGPQ